MKDDPIPDDHQIVRHCSGTRVEGGLPLATAFQMKQTEDYLSVNWLQYRGRDNPKEALDLVRQDILTVRSLGETAKLAVLRVEDVKRVVRELCGSCNITHQPFGQNKSHSGIFGYSPSDLLVASELATLVDAEDVFDAVAS